MSADKMLNDFQEWLAAPITPVHSSTDYAWLAWQAASAAQAGEIERLTRKLVASNALSEERFSTILDLSVALSVALPTAGIREELTGTDDDLLFPSGRELAAELPILDSFVASIARASHPPSAPVQAEQRQKQAPSTTWQRITKPGQVKAGDKLRFTIGDAKYSETAKLILRPGTYEEEIIYNRRQNYYLITSMAIANTGSQKNVESLSAGNSTATPLPIGRFDAAGPEDGL